MPRLGGDDGGSGGFSRAIQKPVDAVTDMFWGIVNFGKFTQDRIGWKYELQIFQWLYFSQRC